MAVVDSPHEVMAARALERYRAGRKGSERLWERARGVLPGGVSGAAKYYAPYPVFLASAHGARATDVDGNDYIDLLMGAGPMLLGHGHPQVLEAVREQVGWMTNPMLPTELSIELAERMRGHMPRPGAPPALHQHRLGGHALRRACGARRYGTQAGGQVRGRLPRLR